VNSIIEEPGVEDFITYTWGITTIEDFGTLQPFVISAIEDPEVRELIFKSGLSAEQFNNLKFYEVNAIKAPEVRQFIKQYNMTIGQFCAFNHYAIRAIQRNADAVRNYMINNKLTIKQFNDLGFENIYDITNPKSKELLFNQYNTNRKRSASVDDLTLRPKFRPRRRPV